MGASFLADFTTGRSIQEGDPAVAVVIVPAQGGYPDPVVAAASPPLLPYDRFIPLSLPLRGHVTEDAGFEPEDGFAKDLLLRTAGFATWKEFLAQATRFDRTFKLSYPGSIARRLGMERDTVAGFCVMHEDTFESLTEASGIREEKSVAVEQAVALATDARARCVAGDQSYYMLASFEAFHPRDPQTPDGRRMPIPMVYSAMGDGSKCHLAREAVATVKDMLRLPRKGEPDTVAADDFRPLYEALYDLQRLSYGMFRVNRIFAPSSHGGGNDNLFQVARMQLDSISAALSQLQGRDLIGPGWDDDFAEKIAALAAKAQEVADEAIALAASLEPDQDVESKPTYPKP